MPAFDLVEFLSEQVEDQVEGEKLYHAIIELGFAEQGTLRTLLRRFSDVIAVIDEELIPLALKVGRRDIGGPTFHNLCAQLDAALRGGLEPEEVSDAAV